MIPYFFIFLELVLKAFKSNPEDDEYSQINEELAEMTPKIKDLVQIVSNKQSHS